MNQGDRVLVKDGREWVPATYEFRITNSEPLGHHSVMLADGGGRRVVCGCSVRDPSEPDAMGFVEVEDPVTGEPLFVQQEKCGQCNGAGKHLGPGGWENVTCSACQGSGRAVREVR